MAGKLFEEVKMKTCRIAICWILIGSLFFGCSQTIVTSKDSLAFEGDRTILVETNDGIVIQFSKDDYKILQENCGEIRGVGKIIHSN